MASNRPAELLYKTGHDIVDASLLRVVQRLKERFGEGIRSYYLTGSYADGTAVEFSDVDLVVVAKNLTDSPDIQRVINLSAPSWPIFEKTVISTYQLTDPLFGQILVHLKGDRETAIRRLNHGSNHAPSHRGVPTTNDRRMQERNSDAT